MWNRQHSCEAKFMGLTRAAAGHGLKKDDNSSALEERV